MGAFRFLLLTAACALACQGCSVNATQTTRSHREIAKPQNPQATRAHPDPRTAAVEPAKNSENPASLAPEHIDVGGVSLRLTPDDCRLTAVSREQEVAHSFAFPKPCHFSLDAQGHPQIVATEHGQTLIVESSERLGERDCRTFLQAIVVHKAQARLSRDIQQVYACAPFAWDEKMFVIFASDTVALAPARP